MELRHLRYFIRAAELLHFTKAAESLFISQPTLSVHIQQLEEELGAELFSRIGRHVRLTEAGDLLLVRARQAVNELEKAGEEIGAISGLLRGTLSISALPLHGSKLMPNWISAFNALHPNVHVKARSGATADIEADILSGIVDLGFSILPPDHNEITTRTLFIDDIVMVVGKKHKFAKQKKVELAELHELPIALASERIASSRETVKYFHEQGVRPQIVVEYDDGHALVEIAKMGNLVTFLPNIAVIQTPDIILLPLPGPGKRVMTGALWTHLSPAAEAFLAVATEKAKQFAEMV